MAKKIPVCWKCSNLKKRKTENNTFVMTGCTECDKIKSYKDAEKLCPLLKGLEQ